jgi:membrane protease YdiL (CAAX protease family)
VWGVWHVPLYGPLGFVVPIVLAFFYTWLHNRTGSVLRAIVLHGGLTAGQDNLVLLAEETHGVTDVAIGIAYLVGVAAIVLATRFRLGATVDDTGDDVTPDDERTGDVRMPVAV